MTGCGIGAIGAKRIGAMLEVNASMKGLSLFGENLLNIHSSSSLIYDGIC
jgi:hypothetical protein